MVENFKPDSSLYKPLRSASAVTNPRSAIQMGSSFYEDCIKGSKMSLDGMDMKHVRKFTEHAGLPSRLGRYSRDDLGLDDRSRFEDRPSLDRWKERLSHGSMCKCTNHPIDQGQDVVSQHRTVAEKISSFACCRDDRRDGSDWNLVEPFPQVRFESSGVPSAYDVPALRKANLENDQRHRSCDAMLSAISMKLETQSKIIEKLHNGLRRLEDERDQYTQLFRELRDELISLSGQMTETPVNASLHRELGVWKHQIVTEIHHLEANVNRVHNHTQEVTLEHSRGVTELRHELSEITRDHKLAEFLLRKKFLSDEVEATRRETRKLLSRTGQLEVDMVGILSENKGLFRRLQKLEKGVQHVVQSQTVLSRDLCKTQKSQQAKDEAGLRQLQRCYGCLSQKLEELTLNPRVEKQRPLKDFSETSLKATLHKHKTGRKSRSKTVKKKSLDPSDLGLVLMSESSSLTSFTDTLSANKDKLAESRRGKESGVNGTTKKAKEKSKKVTMIGDSSDSLSPLPDVDTSDPLTEVEARPITVVEKAQVSEGDTARNHPMEQRNRFSGHTPGTVEESASYSATTATTATTLNCFDTSSDSDSSSSSSSSSTSGSDLVSGSYRSFNRHTERSCLKNV